MNLPETDIVKPIHSRPIGPKGLCTYCNEPIGQAHKPECVCVQRTVVVRLTIDVVSAAPRSHEDHLIEFALGAEGSYCADNTFELLSEWIAREDEGRGGCMCGAVVSAEVLRDATPEDHEQLPLLFDPLTVGQ